jgi:hypothetical protein
MYKFKCQGECITNICRPKINNIPSNVPSFIWKGFQQKIIFILLNPKVLSRQILYQHVTSKKRTDLFLVPDLSKLLQD